MDQVCRFMLCDRRVWAAAWPITPDSPDLAAAAELLDATNEGLLHITGAVWGMRWLILRIDAGDLGCRRPLGSKQKPI